MTMLHLSLLLSRRLKRSVYAVVLVLVSFCCSSAQERPGIDPAVLDLFLKVRLESPTKPGSLKPGGVVEGKLSQDVYRRDRELFPAGSRVRLTVELERQRRVPNDHWPWVVRAFTPRQQNCPTFSSATVFLADGHEVQLQVSLITIRREREVRARVREGKKSDATSTTDLSVAPAITPFSGKSGATATMTLEATEMVPEPLPAFAVPGPATLAAGTQVKIIFLGNVSASKSHAGDSFQARVVEPVRLDSKVVLPEGTLLEGAVVRSAAPRMLSRAGSLLLKFTAITLPGGTATPILASVSAADLDQRSHTKIDPEGRMTGDHPGKAWMLLHIGVTAGIAKVADDGSQLLIEALVSTATDVSTAGTGRIVAACASGLFMLTRHGRDVVLPKFTEMKVTFDRPVVLAGPPAAAQMLRQGQETGDEE